MYDCMINSGGFSSSSTFEGVAFLMHTSGVRAVVAVPCGFVNRTEHVRVPDFSLVFLSTLFFPRMSAGIAWFNVLIF